jgi:hypothetical protein
VDVIITADAPMNVTVSCDKPDIIEVVGAEPVNVSVTITRDGKSAYQSAVENGFIGNEAEWINRLENVDGGLIF